MSWTFNIHRHPQVASKFCFQNLDPPLALMSGINFGFLDMEDGEKTFLASGKVDPEVPAAEEEWRFGFCDCLKSPSWCFIGCILPGKN